MVRSKDTKAIRLRNGIIAFVTLIAILVLGYGTLYSTGGGDAPQAGTDYRVISDVPRARPGEAILVTEYFSYACVHCKNFDPMIESWKDDLPDGVQFERAPVSFSPVWALLAQTYLALEKENALDRHHERIFRAIHDHGRQFLSLEALADFVADDELSQADFQRAASSPEVKRRMASIQNQQNRLDIRGVPTLVVGGRYVIDSSLGRKEMLRVADELITRELAERSGADAT